MIEQPRHRRGFADDLLTIAGLGPVALAELLDLASLVKWNPLELRGSLAGGKVGLIFDKPSTRTRVSLEAAVWALGMLPIALRPDELQLGRGETVADTARTLSRYLDAITIRTFAHTRVEELAEYASIPVINALTDTHHPLQALADLLTLREEFGDLRELRVAYLGDGINNVARSLAEAAVLAGFELIIGAPPSHQPHLAPLVDLAASTETSTGRITLTDDPAAAVAGVDAVYTDVWTSMGQEDEKEGRLGLFAPYQVTDALMGLAAPRAIFLHCLPAHRGEEVTDAVIDGPQSRVFDQAENRLHTSVAVLYALISQDPGGRIVSEEYNTGAAWLPVPGKPATGAQ
jgi:ornithine carbamoyltransferase